MKILLVLLVVCLLSNTVTSNPLPAQNDSTSKTQPAEHDVEANDGSSSDKEISKAEADHEDKDADSIDKNIEEVHSDKPNPAMESKPMADAPDALQVQTLIKEVPTSDGNKDHEKDINDKKTSIATNAAESDEAHGPLVIMDASLLNDANTPTKIDVVMVEEFPHDNFMPNFHFGMIDANEQLHEVDSPEPLVPELIVTPLKHYMSMAEITTDELPSPFNIQEGENFDMTQFSNVNMFPEFQEIDIMSSSGLNMPYSLHTQQLDEDVEQPEIPNKYSSEDNSLNAYNNYAPNYMTDYIQNSHENSYSDTNPLNYGSYEKVSSQFPFLNINLPSTDASYRNSIPIFGSLEVPLNVPVNDYTKYWSSHQYNPIYSGINEYYMQSQPRFNAIQPFSSFRNSMQPFNNQQYQWVYNPVDQHYNPYTNQNLFSVARSNDYYYAPNTGFAHNSQLQQNFHHLNNYRNLFYDRNPNNYFHG